MSAVIAFRTNAIVTAERIAEALKPPGFRVTSTWDSSHREAVHIAPIGQSMGSGAFVADGQQLVIGDDGNLNVEEVGHA